MCLGPNKLGAHVIPKTAQDIAAETDNPYSNPISKEETPWWSLASNSKNVSPQAQQKLAARLNLTKK